MNSKEILPGRLWLAPAKFNEYKTLARFHYLPRRPSTVADVVAAWHAFEPPVAFGRCTDDLSSPYPLVPQWDRPPRCVGVAVLSWPTACSFMRQRVLNLNHLGYRQRLTFVNAHIRTVSRVIIHPTYRALGLATELVRLLIARCPTRYVEASAMMAWAHPLFDRAGMRRYVPADANRCVYFLADRRPFLPALSLPSPVLDSRVRPAATLTSVRPPPAAPPPPLIAATAVA